MLLLTATVTETDAHDRQDLGGYGVLRLLYRSASMCANIFQAEQAHRVAEEQAGRE